MNREEKSKIQLPWETIQANAIAFSRRWKDARNEEAQGQTFVVDFLRVFGVDDPEATEEQKAEIEKLAQSVLDARARFPESSLADLYDLLTMPPELLKVHRNLDRAVIKLYAFPKDTTEPQCIAALMELYKTQIERKKLI